MVQAALLPTEIVELYMYSDVRGLRDQTLYRVLNGPIRSTSLNSGHRVGNSLFLLILMLYCAI